MIKKELSRFIIAGLAAVGTDMLSYYLLMNIMSKSWAKACSFLIGTVVAYLINKFWTFGKHQKSYSEVSKFLLLYLFSLMVNVTINKSILSLNPSDKLIVFIAFIFATGSSAVINFIGQKFWVFKNKAI